MVNLTTAVPASRILRCIHKEARHVSVEFNAFVSSGNSATIWLGMDPSVGLLNRSLTDCAFKAGLMAGLGWKKNCGELQSTHHTFYYGRY